MRATRNRLFTAVTVFVTAMVAGAWTTSTRTKQAEDGVLDIDLLMNGYNEEAGVPDTYPGTLCIFHIAEYGEGTPPFTIHWYGIFTYQGSSLNEDEYLPSTPDTYYEDAYLTDAVDNWGYDYIYVPVSYSGGGCEG